MPILELPTPATAPATAPTSRPAATPRDPDAPMLRRQRYWNRRLDARNWKQPARGGGSAWDRAYATFLAPDTVDAFGMLGELAGRRVLDLACGTGQGTLHLACRGAKVVGFDLAYRRCAVAHRHAGGWIAPGAASFCSGHAERLPFRDGSFDLIFARDILMYADPSTVARECHRLLVPGGRVVFCEALRGHALLAAFRRWTSPPEYLAFTHHLRWNELARVGGPLELVECRAHYLLSLVAFAALFVARSERLYRACLARLFPLDARFLRAFPALAGLAWRGAALYRRRGTDGG